MTTLHTRIKGLLLVSAIGLSACGESSTDMNADRHLERAAAYETQGQYKAAIIEYKNALKKSNGESASYTAYANMLNDLGQYQPALSLLEQYQGESDLPLALARIDSLLGMGKHRSAKERIAELDSLPAHREQLLLAKIASAEGRKDEALRLFGKLLDHAEVGDAARLGTSALKAQEGDFEQAESLLTPIPETSEYYARAQLLLAGINIARNRMEGAENVLTELLSKLPNTDIMQPERASALERLSYVLTRLGRSNEAYIYTKTLSEAFPGVTEVNEQYSSAVEQFKAGDLDAARSLLTGITEKYPNYDKATQLLGIVTYLQGDTEVASDLLSSSVDPEVADPLAKHIYAASRLKLNDPKKVLEILEPDIGASTVAQTWVLYGLAAISDGQLNKGESALMKAAELAPDDVRVRLSLASFYRTTRENKRKEWMHLEDALELAPTDRQVLQDVVAYQLRNKGEAAAADFIDAQVKQHPDAFAPQLIAGYYHASQNRISKALSYFDRASRIKTKGDDYLNAMFARGKAELSLDRFDDALRTFNELAKEYPNSEQAYRGLYTAHLRLDGPDAAREKLESLAKRNAVIAPYAVLVQTSLSNTDLKTARSYYKRAQDLDEDAEVLKRLSASIKYMDAVVALQQGDLDQSRAHIAGLLNEQPDNLRLLSFLVDIEVRAGALKEAKKVVAQIERLHPKHPLVAVLKGDIAAAGKDFEGAQGYYQKAWNENPSDLSGQKLHSILFAQRRETEQARHLQEWLTKLPNSVPGLLYQSMQHQQRGQRQRAAEGYERLLKLAPNHVSALNNLGWLYFEQGDERSLPLLERAVQLAPEAPAVLDSYGWVLFKQGEKQKGLEYLRKASKLDPENAEIAAHVEEAEASL